MPPPVGPVLGVKITAFQRNAFQNNAFQIGGTGAQYFLLRPHFILNRFIDQWTIVTDNIDVPGGWVPTMEVDPLNQPAVDAFYAAGPRIQPQSAAVDLQNAFVPPGKFNVWQKPITFWVQTAPNTWSLTGLGSNKPPVHV